MARNENAGGKKSAAGEIMVGGFFTFLFMTGIGLASNTLLLLLGFVVSVPVNVTGYTDAKTQALWLVFAVVSELFCMAFGFFFERNIGMNAAEFRAANDEPRRPDVPAMFLTVGLGILLHGALVTAVALSLMQALFFAGPVQYFARFIAHAGRAVFDASALNFRTDVKLWAVGFYLLFFAAALFAGYLAGHAERIREIAEREERAQSDRHADAWSREDAEAAWHDEARASAEAPKEERHVLRPESERFFRELGRREKIGAVCVILGWTAVDIGLWYLYGVRSGRGFMSPFSVAFPTLLILPFWPFRIHKRIAAKSFYAEIAKVDMKTVGTGRGGGSLRVRGVQASVSPGKSADRQKLRLLLRSRLGGTEEVLLPPDTEIHYAEGMQVFCAGGLKYPIPCTFDEDRLVLCPVCGHESTPGAFRCRQCLRRLGRTR